ncbi:MAG: SLBB domain-containing protein, partial [bacterium]
YYLGKEGEVLMKVNILGYVQRPGQYLIPRQTDLISLIAFAGGFRDGANISQVRIIRTRNFEQGANGQNDKNEKIKTLSVNVKNYFEAAERGKIPTLEGGDIVLISQSFGNKFRHFLGFTSLLGLIAVTATVVYAISRI